MEGGPGDRSDDCGEVPADESKVAGSAAAVRGGATSRAMRSRSSFERESRDTVGSSLSPSAGGVCSEMFADLDAPFALLLFSRVAVVHAKASSRGPER